MQFNDGLAAANHELETLRSQLAAASGDAVAFKEMLTSAEAGVAAARERIAELEKDLAEARSRDMSDRVEQMGNALGITIAASILSAIESRVEGIAKQVNFPNQLYADTTRLVAQCQKLEKQVRQLKARAAASGRLDIARAKAQSKNSKTARAMLGLGKKRRAK